MKKVFSLMLSCMILISSLFIGINTFAQDNMVNADITVAYCQSNARSIFDMVNSFRGSGDAWYWNESNTAKISCSGLSEYVYDYDLEQIAMKRAAEAAIYYDHERPNGEMWHTVYNEFGYVYRTCGENIAAGHTSASEVFEAWKEDNCDYLGQSHRRNMLSSEFTAIGIACVYYNGYYYWVQEFSNSAINTTPTAANNSGTSVNIDIQSSSVNITQAAASVSSYELECDGTADLPVITATMSINNAWPEGQITANISADWSVSNTSIAKISNGKILGVGEGTTTLSTMICGNQITIPVTVTDACQHNIVIDKAVSATCTETGLTEGSHCSLCGKIIKAQTTIAAIGHSYDNGIITKNASCTEGGVITYTCTKCGATKTEATAKTTHNYVIKNAAKATADVNGYTGDSVCSICGNISSKGQVIPKASQITLSRTSINYTGTVQRPTVTVKDSSGKSLTYLKDFNVTYSNINSTNAGTYTVTVNFIGSNYTGSKTFTYIIVPVTNVTPKLNRNIITANGTIQRPLVTVTDSKGKALVYNKDFTVSYSNFNSTNVGRYTVTVKMIGNYSGTKTYPYYINPKPTTFKSSAQGGFKAVKNGFTLTWNKQTSQTTGYQLQYATKRDFSNAATVWITNPNTTSKTITGRAGNTRYYVRIRPYTKIGTGTFYGDWDYTGNYVKSIVTLK